MFVRTRHTQGPLWSITIEEMPAGHMFTATFIHAQPVPGAFRELTQTVPTQTNPTTAMEVDETTAAAVTGARTSVCTLEYIIFARLKHIIILPG